MPRPNGTGCWVVDEVGYLPLARQAANLLFALVSQRYERGSIIVTSNRGFEHWGDILWDVIIAAALIDRLVHHATLVTSRARGTACANAPTRRSARRATGGALFSVPNSGALFDAVDSVLVTGAARASLTASPRRPAPCSRVSPHAELRRRAARAVRLIAGGNRGANDGSAVNMWDIANHNTVQGNYLAGALNAGRIAHNCNSNIVTGNVIGIVPNGGSAPISQNGILVQANSSSEQLIGNKIGNTALAGIAVADTNDHFVKISQNTFTTVGGLAIDLGPLGAVNLNDTNDVDTGPNYRLNFPVITSARTTAVSGTSAIRSGTFEVFTTTAAVGAYGPGKTCVGSATTSSTGTWALTPSVPLARGVVLTTTATDASGDTSEFGANVAVTS